MSSLTEIGTELDGPGILRHLPQQKPFRFLDEITELSEDRIVGKYTFREDEFFYAGHFPGNPVTPGVILTESMAQVGIVSLAIYLTAQKYGEDALKTWQTFFTDNSIDYHKPVFPGETVIIEAKKIFWRRMKIRSEVKMTKLDGTVVAEGSMSGMGVVHDK